MTALRVQNLFVPDCEDAIRREYYGWGREKLKDGWQGPDWDDADEGDRRSTALRGYGLYDGISVLTDNTVTATDVYATVGFFSRATVYDAVRMVTRADDAAVYLSSIPADCELARASDEQIIAGGSAIQALCAHEVNWGKVTKVLHKKRPTFFPVLDSVLFDFLWKNFPFRLKQNASAADYLRVYRDVLLRHLADANAVRDHLAAHRLPLTDLRVLDYALWLGWRDQVDEFGFGPKITAVWECASLGAARTAARKCWEQYGVDQP